MFKKAFNQYKGVIRYLFFGICTTIINIISYYACTYMIGWTVVSSTVVSWLLAVSFAFITNKIWVFESKTWNKGSVIKEVLSFFLCRIMTGILDLIIMIVSVKILGWNDILMKAISNIAVIMLNYIASKLFIFRASISLLAKS